MPPKSYARRWRSSRCGSRGTRRWKGSARWQEPIVAELEKALRDAEAAKFRLKMQSENETSKLYVEAKTKESVSRKRKGRSPRRAR